MAHNFETEGQSWFVANMRSERERQGITQTELAARMRERGFPFHQQTVQRTEQDEAQRPLRLDEALAIADILGKRFDDLLSRPETRTKRAELATLARSAGQLQSQVHASFQELGAFVVNNENYADFGPLRKQVMKLIKDVDQLDSGLENLLYEIDRLLEPGEIDHREAVNGVLNEVYFGEHSEA